MEDEERCKCVEMIGHLEAVEWQEPPRHYKQSPGPLALGDWTEDPFIWLYYVESCDGTIPENDVMISSDSRYWYIQDVQRYFVGDLHCEKVLFTYQYPNLRMSTQLGSYLWNANTALKLPSALYLKEFNRSLELTLKDNLELVSFENLCCERLEGVRLIQQLACFNSNSLKYLYLWRFVQTNQNPLLINYSYITGSGQYIPRPGSKHCFLRSLGQLKQLQILALEYSHIADYTGGALLSLLPVLKKPHFILHLICREDHVPCRADASLGVGGYGIPDFAWRRVSTACSDLYLIMTFFRIRDYDNVRRFLTSGVPLREVYLQMGIDLKFSQRQDSDVSCFVRHVAFNYANALVSFSVHQWRFATFPLRRVFELMPGLMRFTYTGCVQDEVDLYRTLNIIACGACTRLKQVKLNIQDKESRMDYWSQVVNKINADYKEMLQMLGVNLCVTVYKN